MAASSLSVSIDLEGGERITSSKIGLLEAIRARGSISDAARSLGISRHCAVTWLRTINNALCGPAVATEMGGRAGGGASLTPLGAQLVGLYRAIEAQVQVAAILERGALHTLARSKKNAS
jgi:molybdate transport system regulatory protein